MVSSLNGDGTIDVVYFDSDAEATVRCEEALALEPFEEEEGKEMSQDAKILKERGSILFKLKDYVAAAECYKRGLDSMKRQYRLSVGALVMLNYRNALRVGTASCLEETSVDVSYEDGSPDDDDVPRRAIVAVLPPDQETRILMLTTYLNLARCASHVGRNKDAVVCATLAAGIAQHDEHTDHLITAKILRSRAHLAQNHLKQALRDSAAATELAPSDHKSVQLLARDVERAKRAALRANKQLAKEVSTWVQSAQSKFAEQGGNEADCAQQ
uniref:Uncharacterized protein n=3 Tax=Aureoumbra lagunensis TaxID=44058 RepID=A0A7S3K1L6_9STRA|mmetsp:Transcript_19079/g.24741  ORF Transcript_19079/g.24741 Transcript_19079/m.24741 type:complete len:271 (+) Transcript_19079:275-1087(+)